MIRHCSVQGKEMFPTKGAAEKVAARMGGGSVYRCQYCNQWHVTHYSYEHSKAIRELYKKGIYTLPDKKKKRDMRIYIDTLFNDEVEVVTESMDATETEPAKNVIGLYIRDKQTKRYTCLTYDQALELVEALKIQIAKL